MSQCTCNFLSYTLARSVTINVVIPGPVFSDASPTHIPKAPYPVLYLLHGGWGNENIWLRYTAIERYAEERQIAVVTCGSENTAGSDMSVSIPFGRIRTEEILNPHLTDHREISFSQFIIKELPEFIHGMFPVSSRPEDTYLAGDGYAALNALKILFETPQQYRAIGLLSPCFRSPVQKHLKAYIGQFAHAAVYLAANSQEPYAACSKELSDFLKDAGMIHRSDHYSEDYWSVCDASVVSFLEWLPRTDAYAGHKKRKI
ncbi:MAG: hypothetical protein HDR23_06710 [Lachnospiraceae bacterium]|nr:hypothetical protein [Lachnospiraceae bacterium]MBD5456149.1 hypothetical protein [Lachnospiraceae bacterium]